MYDEYGEFRGRVLINQHEWQVHYFNALDTKMGPDNDDEFHDALEQFADNPDSVIELVIYRTLLDNITQRSAPTKLISDGAQVEISERVTWQSEPHQQHQNPAERQYQNIK
jgi:hypothetical protein